MTTTAVTHALGLVGQGIQKSLSPAMHEQEGRAQGMSVTYRIVDADVSDFGAEDLGSVVHWAKAFGLSGFNVTHPFKKAVIPFLDGLADEAAILGAVNTVVIRDGLSTGYNTDWCGFARPLAERHPEAVRDTVLLIGAGGAGTALAYALLDLGSSHVTINDVIQERSAALVAQMGEHFGADRVSVAADVATALRDVQGLVHATPNGMTSHPGCVVEQDWLHPEQWVYDIVYFPIETELLRRASAVGCRTLDGGGMAAEQAAEAFAYFTGIRPDARRMQAHLRSLVATR